MAEEISGNLYTLEENPFGWQNAILFFEPGAGSVKISTTRANDLDDVWQLPISWLPEPAICYTIRMDSENSPIGEGNFPRISYDRGRKSLEAKGL
jgi:hypothetical protein